MESGRNPVVRGDPGQSRSRSGSTSGYRNAERGWPVMWQTEPRRLRPESETSPPHLRPQWLATLASNTVGQGLDEIC